MMSMKQLFGLKLQKLEHNSKTKSLRLRELSKMQTNCYKMLSGQKELQKISSPMSKRKSKLRKLFSNQQGTVFSQSKKRTIKACQINWNSELKMITSQRSLPPQRKTLTLGRKCLDNLVRLPKYSAKRLN